MSQLETASSSSPWEDASTREPMSSPWTNVGDDDPLDPVDPMGVFVSALQASPLEERIRAVQLLLSATDPNVGNLKSSASEPISTPTDVGNTPSTCSVPLGMDLGEPDRRPATSQEDLRNSTDSDDPTTGLNSSHGVSAPPPGTSGLSLQGRLTTDREDHSRAATPAGRFASTEPASVTEGTVLRAQSIASASRPDGPGSSAVGTDRTPASSSEPSAGDGISPFVVESRAFFNPRSDSSSSDGETSDDLQGTSETPDDAGFTAPTVGSPMLESLGTHFDAGRAISAIGESRSFLPEVSRDAYFDSTPSSFSMMQTIPPGHSRDDGLGPDLTRTNDLLQEILEELRKVPSSFLPSVHRDDNR